MGRKKLKREYTLVYSIDGEEYYSYIVDSYYEVRLTKSTNSAYKLKTYKLLEKKLNDIIRKGQFDLKLAGEIIATPDDYIDLTIEYRKKEIDDAKKLYFEMKDNLPDLNFFNDDTFNRNMYTKLSENLYDLKKFVDKLPRMYQQYRTLLSRKEMLIKTNYNFKNVEFKILDASHNFRYSKLQKLMEDN